MELRNPYRRVQALSERSLDTRGTKKGIPVLLRPARHTTGLAGAHVPQSPKAITQAVDSKLSTASFFIFYK